MHENIILFTHSFLSFTWKPSLGKRDSISFTSDHFATKTGYPFKYNSHTDPRFHSSRILKLADLVEYQAALFVFDLNTKKLPISFNDIFTFNRDLSNARVIRQSDHLYVAKSYNIFASRLPLISIPKIRNKWMNVLTYQTTQGHFKYQLKTHIFDSYNSKRT